MNLKNANILVVMPKRLGDALMCTPGLKLLREEAPEAHIAVWAESGLCGALMQNNPAFDEIFINPSDVTLSEIAPKFDAIVNMHFEVSRRDNPIEKIKALNPDIKVFINEELDFEGRHQSEEPLFLVCKMLGIDFHSVEKVNYIIKPSHKDFESTRELLIKEGVDLEQDLLVGIHLGCSSIAKRGRFWKNLTNRRAWPVKNYIELAKEILLKHPEAKFVLTGSANEVYLARKFAKKIKQTVNLIDKTSIMQFGAVVSLFKCYVVNDTGALHMACAMDVPHVALFGGEATPPCRTGSFPRKEKYRFVQQGRISEITLKEVFNDVSILLSN